ncbi:hypothetical protein, partial [Bradyrhizobium sp. P5_C11_2]
LASPRRLREFLALQHRFLKVIARVDNAEKRARLRGFRAPAHRVAAVGLTLARRRYLDRQSLVSRRVDGAFSTHSRRTRDAIDTRRHFFLVKIAADE